MQTLQPKLVGLGSKFSFSGMEHVEFTVTKIHRDGVTAIGVNGKNKLSRTVPLKQFASDYATGLIQVKKAA